MKVSNFEYLGEFGEDKNMRVHAATVVIESGIWPFKRRDKVRIFRPHDSGYWRFEATGEMPPGHELENLELAYKARKLIEGPRND